MTRLITPILLGLALCAPLPTMAQGEVDRLLTLETPPFGVVFEIAERDRDALNWALPLVRQEIDRLRSRFPTLGIAVVSHGKEEFALAKDMAARYPQVHQAVQSLVKNDVPVHICGTHASWFGKGEEDFPDYVDVTPAGPTEIRNYEAMGYVRIVLKKPQ